MKTPICALLVCFSCHTRWNPLAALPAYGSHMSATEEAAPTSESYAHREDNTFRRAIDQPLSTFSVDVDTASFANVRRFIERGERPPVDAVRIEELINYFRMETRPPNDGSAIAASAEAGPCPWDPNHRLVRIGVTARNIDQSAVPPPIPRAQSHCDTLTFSHGIIIARSRPVPPTYRFGCDLVPCDAFIQGSGRVAMTSFWSDSPMPRSSQADSWHRPITTLKVKNAGFDVATITTRSRCYSAAE